MEEERILQWVPFTYHALAWSHVCGCLLCTIPVTPPPHLEVLKLGHLRKISPPVHSICSTVPAARTAPRPPSWASQTPSGSSN